MSRLFEALSGLKTEHRLAEAIVPLPPIPPADAASVPSPQIKTEHHSLKVVHPLAEPLSVILPESLRAAEASRGDEPNAEETEQRPAHTINVSPASRLVTLTDPASLGAEKFRALVTRFDHLRDERPLKSFQVTSSVIDEGKTVVAGNLAITMAKYSAAKTLLVEGDLHRPTLAQRLGLTELRGLSDWWSARNEELATFVHRLSGMPLWFLPAGKPPDQPSDILRSARFGDAFAQLAAQFEWVVVDSTPMLPIVDVNLWSRLLDGTLLVVREGVTPVKSLKRGLQALDRPKLIGVVVNEATEFDRSSYEGQYYGGAGRAEKSGGSA